MPVRRQRLADQVVVVTGASSGLGREIALRAARRGAAVVVAARRADRLDAVVAAIEDAGGHALAVPTDGRDPAALAALVDAAEATFGRVDTWINNAAAYTWGESGELPPDAIRATLESTFLTAAFGMQAAVPALRRAGGGVIVNVASVLSYRGVPLLGAYVAAKHALRGWSDSLRVELAIAGEPIDVCTVLPAGIATGLDGSETPAVGEVVSPADAPVLRPIPPLYSSALVARAVLLCCEYPRRELSVGLAGDLASLGQRLSPTVSDWIIEGIGYRSTDPDHHNSGVVGFDAVTEAKLASLRVLGEAHRRIPGVALTGRTARAITRGLARRLL